MVTLKFSNTTDIPSIMKIKIYIFCISGCDVGKWVNKKVLFITDYNYIILLFISFSYYMPRDVSRILPLFILNINNAKHKRSFKLINNISVPKTEP